MSKVFTYNVINDVPAFYLEDDDTRMLLTIFQHWIETMHADVSNILKTIDVDIAEEKYLDLMLYESGWDLRIPLTTTLKRKIVKLADYIFINKGIETKIIEVVRLLTSCVVKVETSSQNAFTLDQDMLDVEGVYIWGYGYIFDFFVLTPSLSAALRTMIEHIIDYMRFAVSRYFLYETL